MPKKQKKYKKPATKKKELSGWLRQNVNPYPNKTTKPHRYSKTFKNKVSNAAQTQKYYRTKHAGAYVSKAQLSHYRKRDWINRAPQFPIY